MEAELRWVSAALLRFPAELNAFIGIRQKLERSIILGNYDAAQSILDGMEEQLGLSVYSIQTRLLLAELLGGLEANAQRLSEINKDPSADALLRLLAHFSSMRVERNVSSENFQRTFDKALTAFGKFPMIRSYLEARLNLAGMRDISHLPAVLALENPASIFDRYLNFLTVVQLGVANNEDGVPILLQTIERLVTRIRDPQLTNLLLFLAPRDHLPKAQLNRDFVRVVDSYLAGDHATTATQSRALLNSEPDIFPLYEIYTKSLGFLGGSPEPFGIKDSIQNTILDALYKIYHSSTDQHTAIEALLKVTVTLGSGPLPFGICRMLNDEKAKKFTIPCKLLEAISSSFQNPDLASCAFGVEHRLDLKEA